MKTVWMLIIIMQGVTHGGNGASEFNTENFADKESCLRAQKYVFGTLLENNAQNLDTSGKNNRITNVRTTGGCIEVNVPSIDIKSSVEEPKTQKPLNVNVIEVNRFGKVTLK